MSKRKLEKGYDTVKIPENLQLTPIILADSKGKYLYSREDRKLIWHSKGGRNTNEAYNWLLKNSSELNKSHGNVSLYIWTGTCDLTAKKKKYISLESNTEKILSNYKSNLIKIKDFCSSSQFIKKVTFLQIPYYSIEIWNKSKGHPNSESFKEDDRKLNSLVDSANQFIETINSELGTYTPKFNEDLVRSRKRKGSKGRYSCNFGLFKDGIHPGEALRKAWLASLKRKISKDCV